MLDPNFLEPGKRKGTENDNSLKTPTSLDVNGTSIPTPPESVV